MAKKRKKNPPHRPPHQPTPSSRAAVQALCALGTTQEQICEYLTKFMRLPVKSKHTLQAHYRTELNNAKTHQVLMVSQGLYRKAVGVPAEYDDKGNKIRDEIKPEVVAQIFWLKAQAKWQEPNRFGGGDDGADKGMSLEELIHMSYQAGKKAVPGANGTGNGVPKPDGNGATHK